MRSEENGWVIVNIGHPNGGSKYVLDSTFARTRSAAIKKFISGSGNDWSYWRRKYNFRVVKAQMLIVTDKTEQG